MTGHNGSNRAQARELFSNGDFRFFWLGRVSSAMAGQIIAVAVGWQIYALTGSVFYLGLVGLAQFLPMFLLTLVVGRTADRHDRRSIVCICEFVNAVAALALAAGTAGGWLDKKAILLVAAVFGASRAFEGPSMQSLMPGLIRRELLPRAAALSASSMQTAFIVGPALGGVLYTAGAGACYIAAGAFFLLAGTAIFAIRARRAVVPPEPDALKAVFAGISFIRRNKDILGAISLDLFAVLLGGATAMLPVYARDILGTGPWGLGLLRSAPAMGALLMSLGLSWRPIRTREGRKMFTGVAVFGAATVIFAVSKSFGLSLAALFVLGAADVVSVVVRSSLIQIRTPDDMRGRVSAINSLFIGTSNQLGEFESGMAASIFGVVPSVVIGGLGTLAVVALWIRLFPGLYLADDLTRECSSS